MTYKFISWNIDSLNAALTGNSDRSAMSLVVIDKISKIQPDLIAIQETKLNDDEKKIAKILTILVEKFPGYTTVYRTSTPPARKGYSGTMYLIKETLPLPVVTYPEIGAPDVMDYEGRIITLEFPEFFVTQVYTPNSGEGLKRLKLRQEWDDKYRQYLHSLDQQKPVFSSGDFNVAYQEIDLANPNSNHMNPGFTDEEREKFGLLLEAGFTDSFRYLNGKVEGRYSWFSQRSRFAKKNNTGWRIDYWLVSDRLADKVVVSDMIDSGERQDHVPLLLEISI
ncbi:exodeoxyribonuclease III [Lactovum miscens]|uniref:Exodeoxyribonuclease n=1 Tax=Lactovum miscens TaxID=190387 RepID=A0A841C7N7_9LACT|nr:exodeoxyribonuclease III [Lactovum miscens]MBB5888803.1 exodeoxyribonuclease-3 [Lactovum miscens]